MAELQDYFCGVANSEKHSQIVNLEMLPRISKVTDENGNVTEYLHGYDRFLAVGEYETRTYVFEGVPVAMADALPASVVVTDVGGASHTVHFSTYVKDGSSGSAIFENDSNTVSIHRMSPHMRRIEVVRRIGALYVNGVIVVSAPSW